MDFQLIAAVATIIASMYGMLRFMLRDNHKDMLNMEKNTMSRIEILEKEQKEFKQEMRHIHNRLDGLYRVILDRTYGKNIPEELK